jgi:hypothetical protein
MSEPVTQIRYASELLCLGHSPDANIQDPVRDGLWMIRFALELVVNAATKPDSEQLLGLQNSLTIRGF